MSDKHRDDSYIFMTRPFWYEMNVSMNLVKQKYAEYLGEEETVIEKRSDAVSLLSRITLQIQELMVQRLKTENPSVVIKDLYKIFDECFHFYMKQKEARKKLTELRINDSSIGDTFEENRNMARSVIDSVNLWLENSVLFQDRIGEPYNQDTFELNQELFIDMYIYGTASRALSLLNLSRKFGEKVLYYGIKITPSQNEPIDILVYHPVIYFNTLLTGNQDIFSVPLEEYKNASNSEFGKGFASVYKMDFLFALRTMSTLQSEMLKDGKYAFTVVDRPDLEKWIDYYTEGKVSGKCFVDAFALTKDNVSSQLRNNDPIIWIMGTNKYRHEIRPLICLENDRIASSHQALEQAKHLWLSIFSNGGMIYTNAEDDLTRAIEKRNEELSDRLVDILREKLHAHYDAGFDEIDVQYYRIFGERDYNYGDYDIVFYAKDAKELFLIEAKFFSDSLTNSGMITDYEKMFKKKGYYEHCRKRYDLVLSEPEKVKNFIGVTGKIAVHCLFVSSKPLEIEFQDDDRVVSFPCLSIFDDYLEGKLLPEYGDDPVRPVHKI